MKQSRTAQLWAQQALGELQEKLGKEPELELPYAPDHWVMLAGTATRFVQEVNLAIKQHNLREHTRRESTRQQQIQQAKKETVVTLQDYEMNIVFWIVKTKGIENGNRQVYVDYPTGRKTAGGKMTELMARLFPKAPAELSDAYTPAPDPFEKWLGNESPEPPSGVDEAPANVQTTNSRNRGTEAGHFHSPHINGLGTCPDLERNQS